VKLDSISKDVSMAPIGLGGRRNLLLVDNCLEQRDLYERALKQEFEILTATRGPEGVTLAEKVRPDAIILDADMAGWEGWETCTELKSNANTADIPVILLTWHDRTRSLPTCQRGGRVGDSSKTMPRGHPASERSRGPWWIRLVKEVISDHVSAVQAPQR
jgi:CheY-like chemotaxis protein